MKKNVKRGLIVVGLLLIAGIIAFLRVWYMPARDVADEKAVVTTAKEIFTAYNTDEKAANAKFLDKAVQLSGEIAETKTNQAGKTVCFLKSDDPFFGVNCTFKENTNLKTGQQVLVKGICTGHMAGADVYLIDCKIVTADQ